MIRSISRILADKLGKGQQVSCNDIAIYTYGFEILLEAIIQIVVILALAGILGIFYSCLTFMSIFFIFRWLEGGVHLDCFLGCILFSTILVITMGKISHIKLSLFVLLSLFFITILFSFLVVLKWVPGGTNKKPITNPIDRRKQKIETIWALIFWISIVILCLFSHLYTISMAAILAVFWSSFFVTPIGYRSISLIDKIYSNLKGGAEYV